MNRELWYYSHRLRDNDTARQEANLERAKLRFAYISGGYRMRGITLWAPWIALAETGATESKAMAVITPSLSASKGMVEDMDGAPESEGMLMERNHMNVHGKPVEVIE